jgi:hypothetical protein
MLKRPLARGANERIRKTIHSIVVCVVARFALPLASTVEPARSFNSAADNNNRHNAVAPKMPRRNARPNPLFIMEEKPVS